MWVVCVQGYSAVSSKIFVHVIEVGEILINMDLDFVLWNVEDDKSISSTRTK